MRQLKMNQIKLYPKDHKKRREEIALKRRDKTRRDITKKKFELELLKLEQIEL